eukprot:926164_1
MAVFNEDLIKKSVFVGEVTLSPEEFQNLEVNQPFEKEFELHGLEDSRGHPPTKRALARGRLRVRFSWRVLNLVSESYMERYQARIKLIGISMVDSSAATAELGYLTLTLAELDYVVGKTQTRCWFTLNDIQLDNCFHDTSFPVSVGTCRNANTSPAPLIQLSWVCDTQSEIVDVYDYFAILIQGIHMVLEDRHLAAIATMVRKARKRWKESKPEFVMASSDPYRINMLPPPVYKETQWKKVFFRSISLSPILMVVTTRSIGAKVEVFSGSGFKSLLDHVIGEALGIGLDRARICLNALILQNLYAQGESFISRVSQHYYRRAMMALSNLLGSVRALGNPAGLFNEMSASVKDIYYEPTSGVIARNPRTIRRVVAKSLIGVLQSGAVGIFGSANRIASGISYGMDRLTFDKDWINRSRTITNEMEGQRASDTFKSGARSLGEGVLRGLSGPIRDPIQGMRKSGLKGFAKGVGTGIIGVFVKPAAGAAQFMTATTSSLKKITSRDDSSVTQAFLRFRYPRAVYEGGYIQQYNEDDAIGFMFIRTSAKGKFQLEYYRTHMQLLSSRVLAVTNKRVLVIQIREYSVTEDLYRLRLEHDLSLQDGLKHAKVDGSSLVLLVPRQEDRLIRKSLAPKAITQSITLGCGFDVDMNKVAALATKINGFIDTERTILRQNLTMVSQLLQRRTQFNDLQVETDPYLARPSGALLQHRQSGSSRGSLSLSVTPRAPHSNEKERMFFGSSSPPPLPLSPSGYNTDGSSTDISESRVSMSPPASQQSSPEVSLRRPRASGEEFKISVQEVDMESESMSELKSIRMCVLEARDLSLLKHRKKPYPVYCQIAVCGEKFLTTMAKRPRLKWDSHFDISIESPEDIVHIRCLCKRTLKTQTLGELKLTVTDLMRVGSQATWWPLTHSKRKSKHSLKHVGGLLIQLVPLWPSDDKRRDSHMLRSPEPSVSLSETPSYHSIDSA